MNINTQSPSSVKQADKVNSSTEQSQAQTHKSPLAQTPRQGASNISELSKTVDSQLSKIKDYDDVDMDKVKAVRSAIENGKLQLDEEQLIAALLDTHK